MIMQSNEIKMPRTGSVLISVSVVVVVIVAAAAAAPLSVQSASNHYFLELVSFAESPVM